MAGINLLSGSEIARIQSFLNLPHLEVLVRHDWGSKSPHYREDLHREVKRRQAKAYPFSDSSISHCPGAGGFAFTIYGSNQFVQIGFDIEERDRVTEPIARRICRTDLEFQKAPSPSSLWSAKEACFKALKGPNQPQIISALEIEEWKAEDSQFETARLKNSEILYSSQIEGVLMKKETFTFAFFIMRP
jgi:4'-phosphopantetheinyl transferase